MRLYPIAISISFLLPTVLSAKNAQKRPEGDSVWSGKCPNLKCPQHHHPLQLTPMKFTSFGCANFSSAMDIPPAYYNDNHDPTLPCCHKRNICYQICGVTKRHCDESFLRCSADKCQTEAEAMWRKDCEKTLKMIRVSIDMGIDCDDYKNLQKTHCRCVSEEKALGLEKEVLQSFYQQYNPAAVDRVDSIVGSLKGPTQFPSLLLKLVEKYPPEFATVTETEWGSLVREEADQGAQNEL